MQLVQMPLVQMLCAQEHFVLILLVPANRLREHPVKYLPAQIRLLSARPVWIHLVQAHP